MSGCALVMAKAPVPGAVKTRLGAVIGLELAATLAAAALLDTLDACSIAFDECYLALDGSFADTVHGRALAQATSHWRVFAQSDGDLGARLAHAHEQVARTGSGEVVQVGMDTPQLTPAQLRAVAAQVRPGSAVLGPALDGGWWVLALHDPAAARVLVDVPMSTPRTHQLTQAALTAAGLDVVATDAVQDIDTLVDAVAVASLAPHTRFASVWRREAGAA
jgi:rSAM/selenodomain-associated transferase 1